MISAMLTATALPALLIHISGVNPYQLPDAPGSMKASVIAFVYGHPFTQKVVEIPLTRLIGEYSYGDGFGYNIGLTIKSSGEFNCEWYGCLGTFGKASGRWSADATGLKLVAMHSDEPLSRSPPEHLRIVSIENQFVLIRNTGLPFPNWQPSRENCFWNHDTVKLIDGVQARRMKEFLDLITIMPPVGASWAVSLGFSPMGHASYSVLSAIIVSENSLFMKHEDWPKAASGSRPAQVTKGHDGLSEETPGAGDGKDETRVILQQAAAKMSSRGHVNQGN